MNIHFRPSAGNDLPGLLALWNEAFPDDGAAAKIFLRISANRDLFSLVAEREGQIVGMAFGFDLVWRRERFRYLYALAVAKCCRGRHLGAALMQEYEAQARAAGCVGVLAVVTPEGPWGFYRALGYSAQLRRRPRRADEPVLPVPDLVYPDIFLEVARAFGESPENQPFVPDADGSPYGVVKRFAGTRPTDTPFLPLTLE